MVGELTSVFCAVFFAIYVHSLGYETKNKESAFRRYLTTDVFFFFTSAVCENPSIICTPFFTRDDSINPTNWYVFGGIG